MKGLSIKKIAAVATGAALVATAFAPIVSAAFSLSKTDVFNDNGTPKVKIVVGSNAAPSDGVWAGNIASAIANQARVYKTVGVSGSAGSGGNGTAAVTDLSAKLVIGGTQTFNNAKTYKSGQDTGTNDLNSDTVAGTKEFPNLVLTDSQVPNLKNSQVTIKWNGTNYTRTIKETLGINADALFDYGDTGNMGVADLELTFDSQNDVNYSLNLGSGIPIYESTTSATKFTDGTNDNIRIPFFGEQYLVKEVDKSNGFVRLIKDQGKLTFAEGDVITGLKGKNTLAGQDVSIKVEAVTAGGPAASTYSAKFVLIDSSGTQVDVYTATTTESLNEQFIGKDGLEVLETLVYIDAINVGASSGVGGVDVTVGTTLLDLYSGKGYPYDSTLTSGPYDYIVTLGYSSDGNYVTAITIGNDHERWKNSPASVGYHPPLYAPADQALTTSGKAGPNEISFLGTKAVDTLGKNFFSVDFEGFANDQSFTNVIFDGSGIHFRDAGDQQHNIPYFIQIAKSTSSDTTFSFDGKTIHYVSNYSADATNLDVNSAGTINGARVIADTNEMVMNVGNVANAANTIDINFGNALNMDDAPLNGYIDINGFYVKINDTNSGVNVDDNKTFQIGFDGNITFAKSTINSSTSSSDYIFSSWTSSKGVAHRDIYFSDVNASDYAAFTGAFVALPGQNDVTYKYVLYSDAGGSAGDLYLLLAGDVNGVQTNLFDTRFDADFKLIGTDIGEDSGITRGLAPHGLGFGAAGADKGYFWPDAADFGEGVSAETYYIATFGIETGGSTTTAAEATADFDTNFYVNTGINLGPTFPNTNLSGYTSDINFNSSRTDGATRFGMDEDPATNTQPAVAYNDQGGKMQVSGGVITFMVPDNPRRVILVVKTAGSTTVTTGGDPLTIAKGETGTTTSGTQITVEDITYSASCGAGTGGGEGTCVATPQNYFEPAAVPSQMVFLDNSAPSGGLILVGGHMVNRLSAQVSNIRDVLTAPGDGKDPWQDTESGNWLVAGYTADDTVSAASEFISAVESIDMKS